MKKLVTTFIVAGFIQACSHPLEIVGEGDIVDLNASSRGCTLEQFNAQDDACVKNVVLGDYSVNYSAVARAGSEFVRWEGPCGGVSSYPDCAHEVSAAVVQQFYFRTVPATTAVFCPTDSILYRQDFEAMTPGQGFPPNDLADDGWLIFGNEYSVNPYTNPESLPANSYGPFPAADGPPGSIQAVAGDEGGAAQGAQHLNKFTDYENQGQSTLFVEALTLQEFSVRAQDVGPITLYFDAKRKSPEDFGVGGQSSAYAFITTLDPNNFGQKGYTRLDMTTAGNTDRWGRYSLTLEITEEMVGDILQFGFSATAFNFEPSGIYYDNIFFGSCGALPL